MRLCGVDEAGRGCIIGPLVMCAVCVESEDFLKHLGVKDSKLLSPARRAEIAKALSENVEFRIVRAEPCEIDAFLFSSDGSQNLNWLEAEKTVELIRELRPKRAFIDCPSTNPSSYKSFIRERLDFPVDLIVEHKADANYLTAAAASILAKVERDRIIDQIKADVGVDFGSGYLSDPKTASFLKDFWQEHPGIFRQSWAPYRKLKLSKLQRSLGDF
ncbi:ribonuclease HII [Candidatus Woesearchaeota archaeon]|nr:MAG: ribonuclease HII [Candidatus Woesearchaeota archaeon]